ncbi:MAG: IS6 family transposase, partial [Geminicoccales bacterium]
MTRSLFRYVKTSPEISQLAVMMVVRFALSMRNIEDLRHERGIDVCHESIGRWLDRFGPFFTATIRKKRSRSIHRVTQWRWHLDEIFVKIAGQTHYLWRAIDHEGEVHEVFVTKTRDKASALKFLKKAMKRYGRPNVIVTDGLASYRAAMNELGNEDKQQTQQYSNNQAENSHQPFRRRERAMLRFRRLPHLQKFASTHASVHNHFNVQRHLSSRPIFKANRENALQEGRTLIAA